MQLEGETQLSLFLFKPKYDQTHVFVSYFNLCFPIMTWKKSADLLMQENTDKSTDILSMKRLLIDPLTSFNYDLYERTSCIQDAWGRHLKRLQKASCLLLIHSLTDT